MLPVSRLSIIGLGLLGSSVARAVRAHMPGVTITGHDANPAHRETARAIQLCDDVTDTAGAAVIDAELVILCVPVGAMGDVAAEIAPDLPHGVIISDVGSSKASILAALESALPGHHVIPAHPVAGTEQSGPEAGFSSALPQSLVHPDPARRRGCGQSGAAFRLLGAAGREYRDHGCRAS
jgi:cyclohexadieny/prephenate dehydrogenase